MTDAPERLWLTNFTKDQYGARLGRGTVSDLDHNQNPDYPEYTRADLAPSWQPIETAPKSSKAILVHCGDRRNTYAVTWFRLYEGWAIFGGGALNEKPTHWMPLPAPPTEKKPQKGMKR